MKIDTEMVQRWLDAYSHAWITYDPDKTQETLDKVYHNLWVLQFSDEGQCRSFTEWFMLAPDKSKSA